MNTEIPLLSIYIPTYNRSTELIDLLENLKNEGVFANSDIEVVVSDNHSEDDTFSRLEKFKKNETRLVVYKNDENTGLAGNLRDSSFRTTGEYLWIIGDDDRLYKGLIDNCLSILKNHEDIDHLFINHKMIIEGAEPELNYSGTRSGYFNRGLDMYIELASNSGFGGMMYIAGNIFRRDKVVECVKVMDELGEGLTMSPLLAYSLYCSGGAGFLISEPMIDDSLSVCWNDSYYLVFCREYIAITVKMAEYLGLEREVNPLLRNHLQIKYPEIVYSHEKCSDKFGKDNYAMSWMKKYYPLLIPIDFIGWFFKSAFGYVASRIRGK